jgi:dihydropteroate synthase
MPDVMGILNATPDSFSDGGRLPTAAAAVEAGLSMAVDGATWLDIGGESTRPGSRPVPVEEEIRRVVPVITGLIAAGCTARLSVDTTKGSVARAALAAGAVMVNDVSGGEDPDLLAATAAAGARLVLMHRQGLPATMQTQPRYGDVVAEVIDHLRGCAARAEAAGIPRERLLVDPGIGFGKTTAHNLALLRELPRIGKELGLPLLLGISRKRFLALTGGTDYPAPDSLGHVLHALLAPACALLRVHDVRGTMAALRHAGAA